MAQPLKFKNTASKLLLNSTYKSSTSTISDSAKAIKNLTKQKENLETDLKKEGVNTEKKPSLINARL